MEDLVELMIKTDRKPIMEGKEKIGYMYKCVDCGVKILMTFGHLTQRFQTWPNYYRCQSCWNKKKPIQDTSSHRICQGCGVKAPLSYGKWCDICANRDVMSG